MDQILKDSVVVARTAQGAELRGTPLRLARRQVVFELPGHEIVLQASEVLTEFQVIVRERVLYSGRAVVRRTLDTGLVPCPANIRRCASISSWFRICSGARS